MRTGRNSGERTVDDDYFLGMEVTYPEEHGSFDARTSNSSGPHEPAKGRSQAAPPPRFVMPRFIAALLDGH